MCGYKSRIWHWKLLRELWKCCIQVRCCIHLEMVGRLIMMCRIDDVEDGSALRRGFPVAHSIYGIPQTINSANYIYFCALRELERLNNPQLFKIFYGTIQVEECADGKMNWLIFIGDKEWTSSGEIAWLVQLRKSTSKWSITRLEVSFVLQSNSCRHVVRAQCNPPPPGHSLMLGIMFP